ADAEGEREDGGQREERALDKQPGRVAQVLAQSEGDAAAAGGEAGVSRRTRRHRRQGSADLGSERGGVQLAGGPVVGFRERAPLAEGAGVALLPLLGALLDHVN